MVLARARRRGSAKASIELAGDEDRDEELSRDRSWRPRLIGRPALLVNCRGLLDVLRRLGDTTAKSSASPSSIAVSKSRAFTGLGLVAIRFFSASSSLKGKVAPSAMLGRGVGWSTSSAGISADRRGGREPRCRWSSSSGAGVLKRVSSFSEWLDPDEDILSVVARNF